jgi:uncharacterized protein YecE (DUF72 family)
MGEIRFGTSGFGYKEWKPAFYPADLPDKEFLHFYATRFNSVEIDSTFYRMPNAKTIDGWIHATPEDFRFTIKASQQITHRERLRVPSDALEYLMGSVRRLEKRLGLVLFQLPPYSKCDLGKLAVFLGGLPYGVRAAIEFRNETWCVQPTFDLLRAHQVALCIHDSDNLGTPLEVTAPYTYIRLRRSHYDAAQRDEWVHRIREWADHGVDVFAYIKHEDNPDAPQIAHEWADALHVSVTPH